MLLVSVWPLQFEFTSDRLTLGISSFFALDRRAISLESVFERAPYLGLGFYAARMLKLKAAPAFAAIAALAVTMEAFQVFAIGRHPRLTDVLFASVLGAIGVAFARVEARSYSLFALLISIVAGAAAVIMLFAIASDRRAIIGVDSWDCDARVHIGGESGGYRFWKGEFSHLAVYPRPLSPDYVRRLTQVRASSSALISYGDEVGADVSTSFAKFSDPFRTSDREHLLTFEPKGVLSFSGKEGLVAENSAERLCREIQGVGDFSIVLRARSHELNQLGPARLFSFSQSTARQNIMLGQQGHLLVVRVRSSLKPANEMTYRLEVDVKDWMRYQTIVVTSKADVIRVYIDGQLKARRDHKNYRPSVYRQFVPIFWLVFATCWLLGGALAAIDLFLGRRSSVCAAFGVLVFVAIAIGIGPAFSLAGAAAMGAGALSARGLLARIAAPN